MHKLRLSLDTSNQVQELNDAANGIDNNIVELDIEVTAQGLRGSYSAPEVPTISREQFERDVASEPPPLRTASSGGVAVGGLVPMVAKPVPIEQYNSRVGRARLANAARIQARSRACLLDPATVASMDSSQPGTAPLIAPSAAPPPAPAPAPAPAPPSNLLD